MICEICGFDTGYESPGFPCDRCGAVKEADGGSIYNPKGIEERVEHFDKINGYDPYENM